MMTSLTVRNLDDLTHRALKVRAAAHGRSMEAEVRHILSECVAGWKNEQKPRVTGRDLMERIRAQFKEEDFAAWEDFELPEREPMGPPRVDFDHPDYDSD